MPSKQPSFTATEIKAGVFVLVSGTLLLIFIAAVIEYRPRRDTNTFYADFSDVGGLNEGADVRFGGVKVGRVSAVEPSPADRSKIRVTAYVDADTPVNADSTAYVGQTTLTAAKHFEITTGTPDAALLENRAVLPQGQGGLFGTLETLATDASSLIGDVQTLLGASNAADAADGSGESVKTVAELLADVSLVLDDVRGLVGVTDKEGKPVFDAKERRTLADVLASLDSALEEGETLLADARVLIEDNRENIARTLESAEDATSSANELIGRMNEVVDENRDNIKRSIDDVADLLEGVQGAVEDLRTLTASIQGVLQTNEPTIENILIDLRQTLQNLDELTRLLSEQPQALIRGRKPQGREY